MAEEFGVEGFAALAQALKQFPARVERKILRSAAQAGGQVVLKAARQNVPVKTGRLKKSIVRRSRAGRKIPGQVAVSVGITEEGFYGRFLEEGTFKYPATPWLRPALDDNISEIISAIRDRLKKRIEAEAGKAAKASGMRRLK